MADNTNRLAGTAYMAVDGVSVSLVGEFSWRPASPTRETMLGMDGPHGYSEKPGIGQIKAKLRDSSKVSVNDIANQTNVTVTVVLANGKTIVGAGMYITEPPVVSTDDATIDLTWEGRSVLEV